VPACRRDGTDLVLEVRVQPRAAGSGLAGLHGERLRIRLQAPPRARVTIEHGLTGRDKRLRLHGVTTVPAPVAAVLGAI
jgi:uncharacterized protein YggU (UPF0235/DUF167 family)